MSKVQHSDDDLRTAAMRLWNEAVPIGGSIAERYLTAKRKLVLPSDVSPRVLRFHPSCPFGKDTRHPCLLALFRSIVGDEPRAIMRTALTADAHKIGRKILGPASEGAIKVSNNIAETTTLTVGEGLETTLAAMAIGFAPAWALGSASEIAKFPVLAGIAALTVLGETNDGGANEHAVGECAARWNAAGRRVDRAIPLIGDNLTDALTDPSEENGHE